MVTYRTKVRKTLDTTKKRRLRRVIMFLVVIIILFVVFFLRFGSTLVMDMRFKFNLFPSFLSGEKMYISQEHIRAFSVKSPPSGRVNLSAPLLLETRVYVTDRRVIFIVHIFRILAGEHSLWFEGRDESEARDIIKGVNIGKRPLLGPYLEITSENPTKRWYRGRQLRSRFFMKKPESVYNVIIEAMAKNPDKNKDVSEISSEQSTQDNRQ